MLSNRGGTTCFRNGATTTAASTTTTTATSTAGIHTVTCTNTGAVGSALTT